MTLQPGNPMRVVLLSLLLFETVVFGLAIPEPWGEASVSVPA